MIKQKSFATPIKHRWRKEIRRFLRQTVLKEKKPEEIKVLCMPGAEALEITEVYDMLSIPRKNIWAVEIDKNAYECLESKALGIHLFKGDVYDAIHLLNQKFDVISLDFCGYFTFKHLFLLSAIFRRELLNHNGVLLTNFLAGRERIIEQSLYELFYRFYDYFTHLLIRQAKWIGSKELVYKFEEQRKVIEKMSPNKVKRDSIDLMILNSGLGISFEILIGLKSLIKLPAEEQMKYLDVFDSRLADCIDAFKDRAMIPKKIKRLMYVSSPSVMKSSFFQFGKANKTLMNVRKVELWSMLSDICFKFPSSLPPIKVIPVPLQPKPSKKEVIEFIRRGE